MKEKEYKEGVGNPFDAPIPGQSLTDTPGNYPWEHPPQYVDPEIAAENIWHSLHRRELTDQVIAMLDAGIPEEVEKAVEGVRKEIKKVGIMSKPEPEGEE